jgi:hypothetical protein
MNAVGSWDFESEKIMIGEGENGGTLLPWWLGPDGAEAIASGNHISLSGWAFIKCFMTANQTAHAFPSVPSR